MSNGTASASRTLYRLTKAAALLAGGAATLICLQALAALIHPSPAFRIPVAALVGIVVPAWVASRLMPDALERKTDGLTTDLLAVGWSAVAFLLAGVLHDQTGRWLVAEAGRLEQEIGGPVATAARWLAGLEPFAPQTPAGGNGPQDGRAGSNVEAKDGGVVSAATASSGGPGGHPAGGADAARGDGGQDDIAAGAGGDAGSRPRSADGGGQPASAPLNPGADDTPGRSALGPASAIGEPPTKSWREVERALAGSLVSVAVGTTTGVRAVTGICIGQRGLVVTTHRPLTSARAVAVRQPDGFWIRGATLLDSDPRHDLSLLRLRESDATAPLLLPVAEARAPDGARHARCAANPLGLGMTIVDVSLHPIEGPNALWAGQLDAVHSCAPGSVVVGLDGALFGLVGSGPASGTHDGRLHLTGVEAIAALVNATRRPDPVPIAALDPAELW